MSTPFHAVSIRWQTGEQPAAAVFRLTGMLSRRVALLAILAAPVALAAGAAQRTSPPVTIPFERPGRHVIVQVTINKSRPLSFILDSGANLAIVRTDVAKELGLKLEGQVNGRGAGAG